MFHLFHECTFSKLARRASSVVLKKKVLFALDDFMKNGKNIYFFHISFLLHIPYVLIVLFFLGIFNDKK